MFYGREIILLIYVDNMVFFGTDQDKIDEVIKEVEDYGISLTVEEGVYDFLGFEVYTDKQPGKVTLTQVGLTNTVLKIVVMLDSNNKTTPEATIPLVKYSYGPTFDEPWECASVMRILVYLSSNSRHGI